MGKIVINHADAGIVLDVDTLRMFIDEARAAHNGDADSKAILPGSAFYVATVLEQLLND